MQNIKDFTLDELRGELVKIGEKPFRAEQIFSWIYRENVTSFEEMTNLSKDLRKKLEENYTLNNYKITTKNSTFHLFVKFLICVPSAYGSPKKLMQ